MNLLTSLCGQWVQNKLVTVTCLEQMTFRDHRGLRHRWWTDKVTLINVEKEIRWGPEVRKLYD